VRRFPIRLDPRAELEARRAYLWYLERNPLAAERFQAALTESIDALAEAPLRYPEIEAGIHRRLLPGRFPYGVIYRTRSAEVQVLAVMHLHRRPGYWRT
jgi:plasmid stabilization system protein ParE